jgi:hypothetical protein
VAESSRERCEGGGRLAPGDDGKARGDQHSLRRLRLVRHSERREVLAVRTRWLRSLRLHGSQGGGASLTPLGSDLVARFRALEQAAEPLVREHLGPLEAMAMRSAGGKPMPGTVNGRSLADEALRKQPKLKVLFTTGYTRNAIVHHGRLDPGIHLLTKPYSFQQLALKVRERLDAEEKKDCGCD